MDNITKFLNKVAYKFPKGYPDINDPLDRDLLESLLGTSLTEAEEEKKEDNKIDHKERLIDLIKNSDMSSEVAEQIERLLANSTFKPAIIDYIKSKGFTEDKFKVGDSAIDYIFKKLSATEIDDFIDYIQDPVKLSSLPRNSNFSEELGLPKNLILDLINIEPGQDSGGSSIGKGEVFLGLTFLDVDNRAGGGDLNWNNKNFEIKGSGGRLGQQGGRSTSIPWEEFLVKDIVPEDKKEEFLAASKGTLARSMTVGITMLAEYAKATNTESLLLKNYVKLLENVYYSKGFTQKYIKSFSDLTNADYLKKSINKILFKSYAKKNNVDYFLFFDKESNYRIVSVSNIDEEVENGNVNTVTNDPKGYFWTDPYPNMRFAI